MDKPYSPACDRNSEPILEKLKLIIKPEHNLLLEVGAGTGQHAVYIAQHFPHLKWVLSDQALHHEGIKLWLSESNYDNIEGPIEYEVGLSDFPKGNFDIVFTANTFHIMPWKTVQLFIKDLGKNLKEHALVIIYGPFNYLGKYTSESNEKFDQWLKRENPEMGIRNFEDILTEMAKSNMHLLNDYQMPANNKLLLFEMSPSAAYALSKK